MNITRVICAGALLLAGSAAAQEGGKPIQKTTVSLGTATPGGGFPLYGNALAQVMNDADPTLSIEPRNTKGSYENIPLLEAGQLDIALVAGEPSYEAFKGIGRPATGLKILSAMYSSPGMFVVRADSSYKTIRDLVGKPVAFGARGSGLPVMSRFMLDGLGLKQDEDFQSVYLDDAGGKPRWRAIHRPRRRRDRARQSQARIPETDDDSGGQLSEPERADRFAGIMEFCSRTRRSRRRRRLSAGAHAARRRRRALQEAGAGLRNHRRQYGSGGAGCGADSSGRDEIFPRDRRGEVTGTLKG